MSDQEQTNSSKAQPEQGNMENSILMAFNLGVSFNQQTQGTKSVTEVTGELGNTIYTNLKQMYGERMQEDHLLANTEYFLQIAMLGYIIPSICDYEEDFKNKLLSLIGSRATKTARKTDAQRGAQGNIIIS